VIVAANGGAAVEAFESNEFDVVLMDMQMPGMDGFEATPAIRAKEKVTGRHVPIIAMTALGLKGDQDRCISAGMDASFETDLHKRIISNRTHAIKQRLSSGE
jgi:two-component system sensor histidine kinase/response regulator